LARVLLVQGEQSILESALEGLEDIRFLQLVVGVENR